MDDKKNYKFDDTSKIQPVPIIISEGKYEGIKFQYGRIAFNEQEDSMALKFDYNLIENPNELKEDQELVDTLGDILMDVLEEEIETGESFLKETKETVENENS
jgi:hypothetical protein